MHALRQSFSKEAAASELSPKQNNPSDYFLGSPKDNMYLVSF